MAANDAFTAGVRPGGLTSSTEIRLLLCYLVKNAGPIARQEIENALMEEALVNYFEIGSCLDDITRQQLVTVQDNVYSITDKGRKVAQELAYDLPRSVRERAVAAVLRCQTWARKEAKYSASITEKPDGHCSVRCTVKGLDEALFCLDLGTPDRLSAELVKKQFILKGNEIYQLLVNKLIEENGNEKNILTFGPVCILPEHQRRGYGKRLLEHSFERAAAAGYDVIVIFGSPNNYVSRGFKSCKKFNVCTEDGTFPAAMLIKELKPGTLENGKKYVYRPSPVFTFDEKEAERFDAGLEKMEKECRPEQEEFYNQCTILYKHLFKLCNVLFPNCTFIHSTIPALIKDMHSSLFRSFCKKPPKIWAHFLFLSGFSCCKHPVAAGI